MLSPFKREKVDLSKLSPEERTLAMYGKVPARRPMDLLNRGRPRRGLPLERKFFDSGDYALSKAGRAPQSIVGTAIPNPENIPHASSSGNGHNNGQKMISISPTSSMSPVNKESSLAKDENTIPDCEQSRSGEEIIVDKIALKVSEFSGSGEEEETVVDITALKVSEYPGSGEEEETVVDKTAFGVSEYPGSGEEETVVDKTTTET